MNSTSTFTSRIEIVFWNFAIQLLSNSQRVRSLLGQLYRLVSISPVVSVILLAAFSGMIGLFSGLMFFYVSAILR